MLKEASIACSLQSVLSRQGIHRHPSSTERVLGSKPFHLPLPSTCQTSLPCLFRENILCRNICWHIVVIALHIFLWFWFLLL